MIKDFDTYIKESRLGRNLRTSFSDEMRKEDKYKGDLYYVLELLDEASKYDNIEDDIISSFVARVYYTCKISHKPDNGVDIWNDFSEFMGFSKKTKKSYWGEYDWESSRLIKKYKHNYKEIITKIYDFLKISMDKYNGRIDFTKFDLNTFKPYKFYDKHLIISDSRPVKPGIYFNNE